jgi:hypothetical protein
MVEFYYRVLLISIVCGTLLYGCRYIWYVVLTI